MFGRFMPREGNFFELFNQHAEFIVQGGVALAALMDSLLANPAEAERHAQDVYRAETSADRVTHEAIALLHKTFITPLDRDEIHSLITGMDDILDLMQDAAESLTLYDIRKITPDAVQLATISLRCCERVKAAVALLPDNDSSAILRTCEEIDKLESDADRVMRSAMSRLFREESDTRELIKLKAIYELLETVTDRCEDVANILEGIVLENA
ncbi:MAG: DUF47 domain-containing protein [Zoogloea sp.]|nr:DUF47 domain-containing protein [Zoogloea sp.]